MNCIIVDDEARSRRILKAFCEEYCPQLNIIDLADSVAAARILIEKHDLDLVFLDIEMPFEDGLSLLKDYPNGMPFEVVFTTAFEQYALQAIQANAIDYLLKPIQIDELVVAVQRVEQRISLLNSETKLTFLQRQIQEKNIHKIALTTIDGFTFVNPVDIIRCESHGNYTYIYFIDGSFLLLTSTLKHYEDILLQEGDFYRIHRSHLINLRYVRQFIKGKQAYVQLTDDTKIEVSERKRKGLVLALKE